MLGVARSQARNPMQRSVPVLTLSVLVCSATTAAAVEPTAGYPEPVVQWGVQKGETCDDVAAALYGSAKQAGLVLRYNHVRCARGVGLPEGTTLVMPATVTTLPNARLRSINPDVRARPPGGGWSPAAPGAPLFNNHNVNTLEKGRADIEFIDRTRVFLAANTLVVIYGTAAQTQVSKTPPPRVEVEAGEVKVGLAALRGDSDRVDVSLAGGGRVSAASREVVVARKGQTTTVAVFDGKAKVSSAGASVDVPVNFGSRFQTSKPPSPPRPLPPAPAWNDAESTSGPLLALRGDGLIVASWKPVPNARLYRVEVARDEGFRDLIVREEVPASVTSFRAEKLPPGVYHVAVRAIDGEDFLGIATARRSVTLVSARLEGGPGRFGDDLAVSPYAKLLLEPLPGVELALGDGPFGPLPASIDLMSLRPQRLRLRSGADASVTELAVRYAAPRATISAVRGASGVDVRVTLDGAEGVDLARLAPRVHASSAAGPIDAPLVAAGNTFTATLPVAAGPIEGLRIDVLDGRGGVLGTGRYDDDRPAGAPAARARASLPPPGAWTPHLGPSAATGVAWWSPTAADAAAFGVVAGAGKHASLQGVAYATGSAGRLGVEAQVRSDTATGDAAVDSGAWLGARVRVLRTGESRFELAPGLRLAMPLSASGPPLRLEPGRALGGLFGGPGSRMGWVANAVARIRPTSQSTSRTDVAAAQPALLAGAYFDLSSTIRAHAVADGQLLIDYRGSSLLGRGGLTAGVEAGSTVFVSLSARGTPWSDDSGLVSGQLSVGLRETASSAP
jgi:hypothetical protein